MTVKSFRLFTILCVSTLSINSALALPIDWTGVFGVDTHTLSNTCRTSDSISEVDKDPADRDGTQALRNGRCGANFQTYTFRLNPHIIINDGVSLKGELSSGHIRGGLAGGDSANNQDGSGNNAYFFTTPAQRSALNINQLYMELYADTALVKIGRVSRDYGMGMIFHGGTGAWDRFITMYDGIEAEMKIGDFSVIPYYAKLSSYSDDSLGGRGMADPSGASDVRELGLIAKYDNKNRDLVATIMYAKRSSEPGNTLYNADVSDSTTSPSHNRGRTDVTIIEPYVSKKWDKLQVSFEGSIQSGNFGDVYQSGNSVSYSANAYLGEIKYEINPKWDVGFLAGQADGDNGDSGSFGAAYLNPNFHIADLMFRYNYAAFNEGGRSVFDSSITNARFFKLYGNYKTDKWTLKSAFIYATALQTASNGGTAYHHEESYAFDSDANQSNDYGYELDLGFDYRWNPNVTIGGYYAYWFVGDYYSFTNGNGPSSLSLSNVHGGGLRATLKF